MAQHHARTSPELRRYRNKTWKSQELALTHTSFIFQHYDLRHAFRVMGSATDGAGGWGVFPDRAKPLKPSIGSFGRFPLFENGRLALTSIPCGDNPHPVRNRRAFQKLPQPIAVIGIA
jgi:hypothetical protein